MAAIQFLNSLLQDFLRRPLAGARRERSRRSRGSALLEGALVVSIVIFTLIGIVDVGQVLVIHQGLAERTRAGARYGVVRAYDEAAIRNVVLYNTPNPPSGSQPLLNLSPANVIVTPLNPGTPETRIEVRIQNYRFRFFTPLIKGEYLARPIICSMPVEDQTGSVY